MLTDHAPVLMGYDTGYGRVVDRALLVLAWLGVGMAMLAAAAAARRAVRGGPGRSRALLLFAVVNVASCWWRCRTCRQSPLSAVPDGRDPVFLADAFGRGPVGRRGPVLGVADRHRSRRFARPGAARRRPGRAWRGFVARAPARRRPSLLHRLLPRHAASTSSRRSASCARRSSARHDRVFFASATPSSGARGRAHPGEPDGRGTAREEARRARRQLRAPRPREAGAVRPLAQGRPGGALPGAGVPDP